MSTPAPYEAPDRGWMGDRSRGAGMGRPTHGLKLGARVKLRRVVSDGNRASDYDKGGAYWGSVLGNLIREWDATAAQYVTCWAPAPLWCAWDDFGGVQWIRAATREEAKKKLPEGTRFYR